MNRSASRPGSQRFAHSRGPEAFHRAGPGHALRPGTGRAPGATVHGEASLIGSQRSPPIRPAGRRTAQARRLCYPVRNSKLNAPDSCTRGILACHCLLRAELKPAVEPVAQEYERIFGVPIQVQYGGSGTLLSNLRVAGRGDLFIAADDSYMQLARSNGLVAEIIPLVHMVPVLAVRRGNPKNLHGLADLLQPGVTLVMANPEVAAIGKVVRDLLQKSGEWPALVRQIKVLKPTVNDVANDLKLGAADAGIVWDATARQYPELEGIGLESFAAVENTVPVGVLKSCPQPRSALRFARYLGARDRGLRQFERTGYQPVRGDAWAETPEVVLFSGGTNRVALEEALRRFEEREGARVTCDYNDCRVLVSRIKAGARPDACLACDVSVLRPMREDFDRVIEACGQSYAIHRRSDHPYLMERLLAALCPAESVGFGWRMGQPAR